MKRILSLILLFAGLGYPACTKMNMPTDYSTVSSGTRANLKLNFDEAQNRFNPCADSVDEIRGRFTGYSASLLMTSLENLRLRLDSDASATAKFIVEGSSSDTIFRVSEDSTARFFGALTATKVTGSDSLIGSHLKTAGNLIVGGTTAITGVATLTAQPILSSLTASLPVFTDGSKGLVSNAMTGTGSVMMSASPTTTGTLTGAAATFSGNLTLSALSAGRIPLVTTAGLITQGEAYWNSTGVGFGAGASSPAFDLDVVRTAAAGTVTQRILNNDTDPSSGVRLLLGAASATAGDPRVHFAINGGGADWVVAVDNSDGDAFVVSESGTPGTNNRIKIAVGGAVTIPGTLGVTGKLTGSDSVVATLGLRVGSDANLNRSGTNMLDTPDSLTVQGRLEVTGVTTAAGGLTLGSRFIDKTTSITSNTTLSTVHSTIFADATSGSITLTLPSASGNAGLTYSIYKADLSTNTLTISGLGASGLGAEIFYGNRGESRLLLVCDGSQWRTRDLHDQGTFTATLTGFTTTVSGTAFFNRDDNGVNLRLPELTGTSNSTACTLTGIPLGLRPKSDVDIVLYSVIDNGTSYPGKIVNVFAGSVTVSFRSTLTTTTSTFTNSGTKGIGASFLPYTLQ